MAPETEPEEKPDTDTPETPPTAGAFGNIKAFLTSRKGLADEIATLRAESARLTGELAKVTSERDKLKADNAAQTEMLTAIESGMAEFAALPPKKDVPPTAQAAAAAVSAGVAAAVQRLAIPAASLPSAKPNAEEKKPAPDATGIQRLAAMIVVPAHGNN